MALDFLDQLDAEAAARDAGCPSDFVLDSLMAGALDGAEASAVRAHLDEHPACATRYAAMQVDPPLDDVRILATLAKAAPRPPWYSRLLDFRVLGGFLAVAGAATAIALLAGRSPLERTSDPTVRIKGQLKLELRRKRGDVVERVTPGEVLSAADRVRFVIGLPARRAVRVVGVESNGTVYTAWPLPEHAAETVIDAGKGIELPGAVRFAGAGEERLYLVACPPETTPRCTSTGAMTPPACGQDCQLSEFFISLK